MKRTSVSSSNIRSIGYDEASQTLEVEFKSSGIYQYSAVANNLFEQFIAAPSKGRYFDQNIREKFRTVKVG
jgi:hypothetical protein